VTQFEPLPKGGGTAYEEGDADRLFLTAFQELAKTYATRDLVEEYIGEKIFPLRIGWSVVAWSNFSSVIKIPEFTRSFGLTKNGAYLSLYSLSFLTFLCLMFLFSYIFYVTDTCFHSLITTINVAEIKAQANEILGHIYSKEDVEIQERLGGT
jgi:hypothetical protein